ncbi:TPA: hypothetical protein ACGI4L_001480 [Clostridioides difficile]|nr:hypothetical protein [Clostridioides difficile]HBH1328683.1 hypothetical protein [Clostridioides difficile]
MLNRDSKGKLMLNSLDLEIFLDDLFHRCKNKHEVEWLEQSIAEHVEKVAEEVIEDKRL